MEGVAQTFINDATEEERNNLPQVELPILGIQEWVGRHWGVIVNYKLILAQRATLRFDQFVGNVDQVEGDKSKLISTHLFDIQYGFGTSNHIMRSGVHKVKFEYGGVFNVDDGGLMIGIMRPMDYYNKSLYDSLDDISLADNGIVAKYPHVWHNEDKINVVQWYSDGDVVLRKGQHTKVDGFYSDEFYSTDRVGFILDMNNGTLALYKNGNCVGQVISGLDGEYVWYARSLGGRGEIRICEWD